MLKIICDHCNCITEIGSSYFIYYTGRNEANECNLCKECFDKFLNWVDNKLEPAEKIENYEKDIRTCNNEIESSRDWWSNKCNEISNDAKALADTLITHWSVSNDKKGKR